MQDMKEFFDKELENGEWYKYYIKRKRLGMFFWKRGGKNYCFHWKGWTDIINEIIETAKGEKNNECGYVAQQAQDFLDCVACLGKEKVKELTENMKEK